MDHDDSWCPYISLFQSLSTIMTTNIWNNKTRTRIIWTNMNEHDKRINSVKSSPANVNVSICFPIISLLYSPYIPLISPCVHASSDHDHTNHTPHRLPVVATSSKMVNSVWRCQWLWTRAIRWDPMIITLPKRWRTRGTWIHVPSGELTINITMENHHFSMGSSL